MSRDQPRILTVGHSNHSPERFVELLRGAGIDVVVDVRSRPYSKYVPHARKRELQTLLSRSGIDYQFAGDRLGGMPDDPDLYQGDRADYDRIAAAPWFASAIEALCTAIRSSERSHALMCAEETCHRRKLLTPAITARGIAVVHLRGDGQLHSEEDLERGQQLSLF